MFIDVATRNVIALVIDVAYQVCVSAFLGREFSSEDSILVLTGKLVEAFALV